MAAPTTEPSEYRYTLTRCLSTSSGTPDGVPTPASPRNTICWIMLNPSTADETVDDPTIRRVKGFSYREGFDNLIVVNLFGLRATQPKRLLEHTNPIGPHNVHHVVAAVQDSARVVLAWGALASPIRRLAWHLPKIARLGDSCGPGSSWCLGTTANGSPRHPLYVKGDQRLVPFDVAVYPDR